jgi:hypothetical protein
LRVCLLHSPKKFWHTIFLYHSPLLLDLDPNSMFSHASTLYDVPGQTLIQVTSPHLLATYSHIKIFRKLFGWWVPTKRQMRKGSKQSSLSTIFMP